MTDQTQKFEETIKELKVRIFDLSEAAQKTSEQAKQFQTALVYIADAANIEINDDTSLQDIVLKVTEIIEKFYDSEDPE